ncbi:MAG: hypothetical protein R3C70_16950 [Geminicoccaceae bacterium]
MNGPRRTMGSGAARMLAILCGLGSLLAGCAGNITGTGLDSDVERAIRHYYEYWAVENRASCTTPRIGTITRVETVSQAEDRLEYRIRYGIVGGIGSGDPGDGPYCTGFNDRRFVLVRDDGQWTVNYMSGWQYKTGNLDLGPIDARVRKPPVLGGVVNKP